MKTKEIDLDKKIVQGKYKNSLEQTDRWLVEQALVTKKKTQKTKPEKEKNDNNTKKIIRLDKLINKANILNLPLEK